MPLSPFFIMFSIGPTRFVFIRISRRLPPGASDLRNV